MRRGGGQFALRLTAPDESFSGEVAALRFWAGRGTVLLIETDLEAGTMLLERLDPPRSLATLESWTSNTLAAQRSSAPSITGCGVSSMDSPRIPGAAGV